MITTVLEYGHNFLTLELFMITLSYMIAFFLTIAAAGYLTNRCCQNLKAMHSKVTFFITFMAMVIVIVFIHELTEHTIDIMDHLLIQHDILDHHS